MTDRGTAFLERRMGDWARARLPGPMAELVMFVLKQGWAALFGGLFLVAIVVTRLVWEPDWWLTRYDALFVFAVATQAIFVAARLESWAEVRVIALFHLTGTAMEVFKLHMGSWDYPDHGHFEIAGVPLFSGFMYAAVGSYIARVIRVFDMAFAPYPPFWATVALAGAIYGNFFWHHFGPDLRVALFAATVLMFGRTRVWFRISDRHWWMPMPVAALMAAFAIWVAENVGTFTQTWTYAGQGALDFVSWGKLGSWYLLLWVSFVTVTLVSREALRREAWTPARVPAA
ncbi:DUF817 domain-containing protein [Jannaschia aquimarina]|uniref:DUF817 domain-containing protein n=1 Tax=Jannaschia aquimarina TaxID=935700 RepID=A0A0D1EEV6_9RHOB|nr:DUF817 domain-containing protein [Jannaschia aquimarina]KIT15421.1 hypothetical protein jaqu_28550 [Jannaschia aquimarina]SNT22590.1 Uncharacterized membrane protein YoaT, DUF817 family [Jannaschia aquimarina]